MHPRSLCWLRRDLRLHDNAALSAALKHGLTVVTFVFDTNILKKLEDKDDRRITFIMEGLQEIQKDLEQHGSSLIILHGKPEEEIPKLAQELKVEAVFTNRDYEPYAKKRDQQVQKKLQTLGIDFFHYKDSVIFEKEEVETNTGGVYKVFTPYKNRWIQHFEQMDKGLPDYRCPHTGYFPLKSQDTDWYGRIGFDHSPAILQGGTKAALNQLKKFKTKMDRYDEDRDYPDREGTSSLSPYLRFGNISIRQVVRLASSSSSSGAKTWLSELIWRDFYQMILDAFPQVAEGPFREEYARIRWAGKTEHFEAWCKGQTGFPIIDASMRCLNATGLMHNRLRMITASFLCKTLLLDWRLGEAYFARKLLDYDLAANNGGWQWSASTGTDAQPYFRIFNPSAQAKKFDPDGEFIRRWCPEWEDPEYPSPIVDYARNRERALLMYSKVKQ